MALLMVKQAAFTDAHTYCRDQTQLWYTRQFYGRHEGPWAGGPCLATQACHSVSEPFFRNISSGSIQTSPQNCRNKDIRWSGCSQHQDKEVALEKAPDDGMNCLSWKPMRLCRGQETPWREEAGFSSRLLSVTPSAPRPEAQVPSDRWAHLCWGRCTVKEGEGLGGPDGASDLRWGHQLFSPVLPTSDQVLSISKVSEKPLLP